MQYFDTRTDIGEKPPPTGVIAFPSLRRLWVQPLTVLSPDQVRVVPESEFWNAFKEAGANVRKGTSVFLLLPDVETGAQHSVDLDAGWRDGVVGGPGFWAGGEDLRYMA